MTATRFVVPVLGGHDYRARTVDEAITRAFEPDARGVYHVQTIRTGAMSEPIHAERRLVDREEVAA